MDIDQHSITYQIPYDKRFPNANQTKACWINFVNFLKVAAKADQESVSLDEVARAGEYSRRYHTLCPNSMVRIPFSITIFFLQFLVLISIID